METGKKIKATKWSNIILFGCCVIMAAADLGYAIVRFVQGEWFIGVNAMLFAIALSVLAWNHRRITWIVSGWEQARNLNTELAIFIGKALKEKNKQEKS